MFTEILLDKKETQKIYGIFDGAIIKDLWLDIDIWNLESYPLYYGNYELVAEAIPYLIELDIMRDKNACENLLSHIGKNAVLLIKTNLVSNLLLQKLRHFYHIKTNENKYALRRFYDPRVFTGFLENLSLDEKLNFFSNIDSFYSEKNEKLISYARQDNKLVTQVVEIKSDHEN